MICAHAPARPFSKAGCELWQPGVRAFLLPGLSRAQPARPTLSGTLVWSLLCCH